MPPKAKLDLSSPYYEFRDYYVNFSEQKTIQSQKFEQISQGLQLFEKQNYSEARLALLECVDLFPNSFYLKRCLGQCCYQLSLNDEAIKHYEDAISINKNRLDLYLDLTLILYDMGEYEKVVDICNVSLEIARQQDDFQSRVALNLDKGKALYKLSQFEESEKSFNYGLKIEPRNDLLLFNKANILRKYRHDYTEAVSLYVKALKEFPHKTYWHNLGLTLKLKGRVDLAEITWKTSELIEGESSKAIEFVLNCKKRTIDYEHSNMIEIILNILR
jgi:tetratricopeptide (TPR) repeat protein